MRTYKVARRTTGGCHERDVDCRQAEEDTSNDSCTGINECAQKYESESEEVIGINSRKRLRSFESDHEIPSGSKPKKKVTFPTGLTEQSPICEHDQLASLNAQMADLKNTLCMSLDEIHTNFDKGLGDILKQKEEKWADERNRLEKKISDRFMANQNMEKELLVVKGQMEKVCNYLSGVTAVTEQMNTDGKKIIMNFQKFLPPN